MVQCINNPQPKCGLRKEGILLAQHVQLWISVKHPRGYELVEDADNKRRKDGENDVVQGKSPGLIDDLAGEVVEKGELRTELAVI